MSNLVLSEAQELKAIEPSKAAQIEATFKPMVEMLKGFEDQYNALISEKETGVTKELTTKAKRLRIDIGKVRIETEKLRVSQKEEYLRAGKAIDGVSNILKWAVSDKEAKLKEIEDHFEIIEAERLKALQIERAEMLSPYVTDAHERQLSSMDDDVWNAYLQAKKNAWEDEQEAKRKAEYEQLERERKAELHAERKELLIPYWSHLRIDYVGLNFGEISQDEFDAIITNTKQAKAKFDEEQEAIRIENERLKKEAEEKERKAEAERKERERIESERKAKEESERKKLEEEKRLSEEKQRKLEAELEEKRNAEAAEAKRKVDEEARKLAEEEAAKQAELNKGDAERVADLIADLNGIKEKYAFKSAKNKKMFIDVQTLINKVVLHIQTR